MDEPILFLRDGASVTEIPLGEVLSMRRAAAEIAEAALSHVPDAKETVEAVIRAATVYGPQRGKASVSAFLLRDAMAEIEDRKQRSAIVVAPAQSVGAAPPVTAPAAAEAGATPPPGVAPGAPCQHPPDIACPNCAGAHQAARNAKKRQGARA